MRVLHVEPFSGMAGDMFMAALIDAGLDQARLETALAGLGLDSFRLDRRQVMRGAIRATKMDVVIRGADGRERRERRDQDHATGRHHHEHPHHPGGDDQDPHHHHHPHHPSQHRHGHEPGHGHAHGMSYREIVALIGGSTLAERPRDRALAIFRRIAEAEARIHGVAVDDVHFHEVGAIDGIVDVCAAALGLELLGIERVTCSAIGLGEGVRRMAHGLVPIPAPATVEIVKGLPVRRSGVADELLTPTGAAILAELVDEFLPRGDLVIESSGYGAGSTDRADPPNVVRVQIGRIETRAVGRDEVVVIETQVDDMTGEALGYLRERLEEAGALDVLIQAVQMKKDRPGQLITLLARPEDESRLGELLLLHSTSLGYRRCPMERRTLEREEETWESPWGPLRLKVVRPEGRAPRWKAEHEDLARIARETGRPLAEIEAEIRRLRG